jgi:hypothetical protein
MRRNIKFRRLSKAWDCVFFQINKVSTPSLWSKSFDYIYGRAHPKLWVPTSKLSALWKVTRTRSPYLPPRRVVWEYFEKLRELSWASSTPFDASSSGFRLPREWDQMQQLSKMQGPFQETRARVSHPIWMSIRHSNMLKVYTLLFEIRDLCPWLPLGPCETCQNSGPKA